MVYRHLHDLELRLLVMSYCFVVEWRDSTCMMYMYIKTRKEARNIRNRVGAESSPHVQQIGFAFSAEHWHAAVSVSVGWWDGVTHKSTILLNSKQYGGRQQRARREAPPYY